MRHAGLLLEGDLYLYYMGGGEQAIGVAQLSQ